MYWVYQTIERPKKKLTKAGRKYHKPFSNDQAMTGCIPQPLVQLFTSFLQFFFSSFLQFFFLQFFTVFLLFFFTVFYKAVEWAGDFGAGDLGGLRGGGSPSQSWTCSAKEGGGFAEWGRRGGGDPETARGYHRHAPPAPAPCPRYPRGLCGHSSPLRHRPLLPGP